VVPVSADLSSSLFRRGGGNGVGLPLPTAKPAAWGCRAHRNEFCKLICLGCWNFWVGLLEFWNFFGLLEFLGCWNFFLFGCFVWLL
jgi:hypothetical protein